jgi:hypothetical protein
VEVPAVCKLTYYDVPRRLAASSRDHVQIRLPFQCADTVLMSNSSATRRQLSCLHVLKQAMHIHVMVTGDRDTPTWSTADLIKYMEKSTSSSSGGRSTASTTLGGIVGSSVAPAAVGVQYMQQPAAVQPQGQPLPQGMNTTTGDCTAHCMQPLANALSVLSQIDNKLGKMVLVSAPSDD